MKVFCILCKKEYSVKGIHTHYDRTHGDETTKSKYSNGNNGKYDKISQNRRETNKHKNNISSEKSCPCCGNKISYKKRRNKFCSATCGNSRGKRTDEFKNKVRAKLSKPNISIECNYCKNVFLTKRNDKKYCNKSCYNKGRVLDKNEKITLQSYRSITKFKFNPYDYPTEFNLDLVKIYGWYSPTNKNNNLFGVSKDHMVSVRYGFDNNIDAKIISHPANCELVLHSYNSSKNKSNSITLDELILRIKIWEEKYDFGGVCEA